MQTDESVRLIEAWFAEHDDGEFGELPRCAPFMVVGPRGPNPRVLYATKPHIIELALEEHYHGKQLGLVGRSGLLKEHDLRCIRQVIGQGEVLFIGDLDPVDLMVFSWLRTRLRPIPVRHLGINDPFLALVQPFDAESVAFALAPSELAALSVLQTILPDLAELLGPQCARILASGRKLELDAIVSLRQTASPIVLAALSVGNLP
jgi:hypothetical protein